MPYPRTADERTALRGRLENEAAERARIQSRQAHYSLRCADGDHGCRNLGPSCLCPCHDPEPQP